MEIQPQSLPWLIQTAPKKGEASEHFQYIDDTIVQENTTEKGFENGEKIIRILLKDSFAITQSKVKGPAQETQVLRVKWQDGYCQTAMDVVNKTAAISPPASEKETQAFLGAVGFWTMHLPDYSDTVSPLYHVTHKRTVVCGVLNNSKLSNKLNMTLSM